MASGNIVERVRGNGEKKYEITVEGERDLLTGKRNRMYKTVGSMKEAKAVMRQMIVDMERGIAVRKSPKKISEWLDEWLELYLPNIEETTRIGYKTKIKNYIKPALGDIYLQSLRAEHVQKLVNDMIARGLSPKNIRDTFNNINAAMKKAVVLRMIPYNPCEGVVLPKRKKYKAKVYDLEMIHKLLDIATGTDMYIPILLCVMVGLRRGEMLALRWEHIDFENKVISVKSNMVNGENGYIIKAPKSEAGIRDIQIGDEVINALKRAKTQYLADKIECGALFQDLQFIVRQPDGSPMSPDAMTRKWRRFIVAHNLPDIRLHDLRHSNATALIQAGVNPRVVQQRLGHSNVSITLNTYTHVLPDMDKDAAQKLDDVILKKA
jgi:integrase